MKNIWHWLKCHHLVIHLLFNVVTVYSMVMLLVVLCNHLRRSDCTVFKSLRNTLDQYICCVNNIQSWFILQWFTMISTLWMGGTLCCLVLLSGQLQFLISIIYISISFTSREIVKKITGLVSQGFWRPNQSWMHLSKKVRTDKVIYLFVSFIWIIILCYFSSTFLFNLNNFPILLY